MFKKLSTSVLIASTMAVATLPVATPNAFAAGAEQEEKKKRPTRLASPSVGKKIAKAFDLYNEDDIDGALAIVLDIDASKEYDQAYVARFIGTFYAMKGDEEKALGYMKKAVEPDILNAADHGAALKLLADLQIMTKDYRGAIKTYKDWMDFTGQEDAQAWVRIASAHNELKEFAQVIKPADSAIKAFGDKQNQNPYVLKITSYYERKMYSEAIDVLETTVQLFPENKLWWLQLGQFYQLTEDYPKALATFDMAYQQGFLDKESHIKALASLYQVREIPIEAAKLYEKHLASGLLKRDEANLFAIANAYHAAMQIDKAAQYYGELATLTSDAKHFRKQGMLLKQDEQFKGAIVALNKALELGADDTGRIHMSLAESHFYLGQYKSAYAAIQKRQKTREHVKWLEVG